MLEMILSGSCKRVKYIFGATVSLLCVIYIAQMNILSDSFMLYKDGNTTLRGWEEGRQYRFPSVEQRIKVYMSNWYLPPCDPFHDAVQYEEVNLDDTFYNVKEAKAGDVIPRYFVVGKHLEVDHMFALTEKELSSCIAKSWGMRFFCIDAQNSIYNHELHSDRNNSLPPLFVQFGDHAKCKVRDNNGSYVKDPSVPLLQKIRRSLSHEELDRVTSTKSGAQCVSARTIPMHALGHAELQPIIWLLKTRRHFRPLKFVTSSDRPWSEKRNAAVFRGTLTGHDKHASYNASEAEEICLSLPRCRIVLQNAHSKLVDAKLSDTFGIIPRAVNGIQLTASEMSQSELLSFKGCIVLEGNDVASGLKWMLLSQSVVLMPPPTFTSWAMEELLVAWVHYIPLKPDLSDVEEKVRWMLDNDAEAQRIAHRGTLWMSDMVLHSDAVADNMLINQEIMRRYRAHFHELQ